MSYKIKTIIAWLVLSFGFISMLFFEHRPEGLSIFLFYVSWGIMIAGGVRIAFLRQTKRLKTKNDILHNRIERIKTNASWKTIALSDANVIASSQVGVRLDEESPDTYAWKVGRKMLDRSRPGDDTIVATITQSVFKYTDPESGKVYYSTPFNKAPETVELHIIDSDLGVLYISNNDANEYYLDIDDFLKKLG